MIKEITDTNFNTEVINTDSTVVVDFWAPWCGPCKMLSPVINEVSDEVGDRAKFVKINVDENPATSREFEIASIPTIGIFKGGEEVTSITGFRPKQELKNTIERYI